MFMEFPAYIIGGWFMNRFGMKKVLVFSGAIYGLGILFSGLVTNVILFIIIQGAIATLAMFGVFIATLALINVLYPNSKGTVMGLLYGSQAVGASAMAPLATYFINVYSVGTALVLQGAAFTIIMVICCLIVVDPTKGDRKLQAKIQEEAEAEEAAEAIAGKAEDAIPSMRWTKALRHPAFWFIFISIICIQMIGNALVSDGVVIAESVYDISSGQSSWFATAFGIGAGIGGLVIGFISDKLGPYRTTFWLGIIDGVLLLALAAVGLNSYMIFFVICVIQGFTYNGMTTLNPIMLTDSYSPKDIGTTMGFMGISYFVVGVIGPQLGLVVPFVPFMLICAALSIIGGFVNSFAKHSLNKYYESVDSKCVVR